MAGSFLIDTDDLSEAEAAIGANYARIRIGAGESGGSTRTRVWRTFLGTLSVDDAEYSYDMSFQMEAPEKVLLSRIRSGAITETSAQGHTTAFGPGMSVAFGFDDLAPFSGTVHRAHYDIFAIDRHLLSEAAGAPGESVRLTASAPVSSEANRQLTDAIDYVRHGVLANAHAAQEPLLTGAVARYLASCMVTAFPRSDSAKPTADYRRDTTPLLLRRAMAFIDDNGHHDISVSDVAAAVQVTPRALQLMFRRHRDCTPMEYLRCVRLDHAHQELLTGDRASTTVGAIARRWGFGHVGRFAVTYREAYGRSPHVTLGQ